ncbi:MAG: ABC transporter substrate-binding protein [Rhizonema sp. NSF051]|nr:ABC transporter substrate-binding protein [Rhizonema sp. NSF051]
MYAADIYKKIFRRSWIWVLLAFWIAIALTGCNPAEYKVKAAQVPQMIDDILSDPKTFNSPLSQESPNIFGLTAEGLTFENPISGKEEPALAESWRTSDDKLKITFTLRPDLKWSDGKPLTVDDVVFTYNDVYLNKAIPTDARDILRVGESRQLPTVRKLDERRVEFTTPEPFAPFLRVTGLPILPAHALQESVNTKDNEGKPLFLTKWGVDTPPEQIIVNGPYKIERYDSSQRIIFRRNPYYWRKGPQGQFQPYIERMVWEIVENTDTSLLQFRSGGLDTVDITPEYFSLLKSQEKQGHFKIYNGGPTPSKLFLMFNLNKGQRNGKPLVNPIKSRWFNTVEFRQAVAYALDRQTMINNIYRGLGTAQNSPIAEQSPYYFSPKQGLRVYDYNLIKAKELLLKGGFKYNGNNQLVDAAGNRVRFSLLTNAGNKIREAMGSQIKQDLGKIGIQVDFTPLAWSTYTDKLSNTLDWEAGLMGLTGGLEPNDGANVWNPQGGLHMFNQKPSAGQKPIQGWEAAPWEQEIGKLYIQAARELDEAKRKALYAETQRITQEYLPFIHMIGQYSLSAVRDRFEGIKFSALGGPLWNIYEIQAKQDK